MKVDAKTKTLLDDYLKKKKGNTPKAPPDSDKEKDEEEGEDGEKKDKEDGEESEKEGMVEEELDENTQREDRVAQAGLEAIMREYAFELAKVPHTPKQCEHGISCFMLT